MIREKDEMGTEACRERERNIVREREREREEKRGETNKKERMSAPQQY